MALILLDIENKFQDKKLLLLIMDEYSSSGDYLLLYIDDENNLWFHENNKFSPFSEIADWVINEIYIHLLIDDDLSHIFKGLSRYSVVEIFLQAMYGRYHFHKQPGKFINI